MTKVTIIGAGSVGSTIAYTLAVGGIATEIVMIDINEEKALGEALDIRQGTPFCPPVSIYAVTLAIPISLFSPPALQESPASPDSTSHRPTLISLNPSFLRLQSTLPTLLMLS